MAARKEAVMNNIRNELALANAQQLMNVCSIPLDSSYGRAKGHDQTTNEKCFEKCVLKPSGSLTRSEEVGILPKS